MSTRVVKLSKPRIELPSPGAPMAVARRLVEAQYEVQATLCLRRWRDGWWTWRTSHWKEVDSATVRADAYAFTEHAVWIDRKKALPEEKPWAPKKSSIGNLLEALGAICHLPDTVRPPEWLHGENGLGAGDLVSVGNGLFHVPTRTLQPHDPRLFNFVGVPFDYDPAAGEPHRWLDFLHALWPNDPESIAALQEWFGYIISGHTDLQKMMLLVGPPRSGKGTIAHILEAMVGDGNYAGSTLASLGMNFGLEPLIGKPLAVISDARLGKGAANVVVERLLSITGEDVLTIDRKNRLAWTGPLPTRFLILSNELPRFGDASGAIATRFNVLALTESWLGKEDPALREKLIPELPAILNWALDGLARLMATGRFTEPDSSRDAIITLQDLVSPVGAFVRDTCRRGPHEVECQRLFSAWKCWAEENGHATGSLQTFGKNLRAVVPGLRERRPRTGEKSNRARPRHYCGIDLSPDYAGPQPLHVHPEREPGEDDDAA